MFKSALGCLRPSSSSIIFTRLLQKPQNPQDNQAAGNIKLEQIRREIEADKELLKWRTPIDKKPDQWSSKLKAFSDDAQTSDFIVAMQQPINLSPEAIKKWWIERKERVECHMQQYIAERHQILGADLAAAHFLLYRGGAVKFVHDKKWMRANEDGEFDLPNTFHATYKVEALRCDNMELYYEGLENLRCLQYLKFLSFHNVKKFDDWCLDRVSGAEYPNLEVLDISGTECTVNGLTCLYRVPTLKLLIVDDPKASLEYELGCSILKDAMPKLKISPASVVHAL